MKQSVISETLQPRIVVEESDKLVNDHGMTYFEQENPWQYEEDGYKVTRGSAWSAPGCHLGCGVLIYSKDGRVHHIEGDPNNPYSQGRLCPRCVAVDQCINNETRLMYPMKRSLENRGKDKWERITWDEALDTIEERFNYYKETFGPQSVMFWQGTGRDIAAYISRLAWSFGSPNYFFSLANVSCFGPRILACSMTTGVFTLGDYSQQFIDRYDNPEYVVPGVTVVWGNNPLPANSDGAYGHWVTDVMQRGSKLLVIDPRLTWLAAHADLWLQVRPGSDGALACAMARVMFEEDIYDEEFCNYWCYGVEEWEESVQPWTLEAAEAVTWVPGEKIAAAARMIATEGPALLQWGVALDQRNDCWFASRAVFSLFCITGNIEKPGSNIVGPELLKYITGWGHEFLPEENDELRAGTDSLLLYKFGLNVGHTGTVIDKMIEQSPDYPVKASWLQTVNPITCASVDNNRTLEAFQKLEFNVCIDLFMTPSIMAFGDIVLPVTTFVERNGIRCGDGTQRGETINKAVEPYGECRSDMEINLEMGRRWNPEAWPWETVEDMFSHILAETGMDFEGVRETAPSYLPFSYNKHEKGLLRPDGTVGFPTQTGRIEIFSTGLNAMGIPAVPFYEEPTMTPFSQPELAQEYPLILSTGARRYNTFHSENRQPGRLRDIYSEPTVEINPKTAENLGLSEGQWVWIEGPIGSTGRVGRAKRIVEMTPTVDERCVSTVHGWWHPEGDPENLYDVMELNINNIISWEPGGSGVGTNYKCVLCKIYPVEDGE